MTAKENSPPQQNGESNGEVTAPDSENSGIQFSAIGIQWQGPLPPPRVLGDYDHVVPGLAKQLADHLPVEAAHNREMEKSILDKTSADHKRRQWMGFATVFIFAGLSAFAIWQGAQWAAVVAIPAIAGIAAVFVIEERKRQSR